MARKKQEYYSLKNILENDCQYNIILGMRSNGKSYSVKEHVIKEAIEHNKKFMLLRRVAEDVKNMYVSSYLNDMIDYLIKLTKGKFNNFRVYNGFIYAELLDENESQIDVIHIGYYRSLNQAERMKSNSYLDVENIVFEEFIATGMYLPMEVNLFDSVISTVARRREIKVFMIGNTISRNCIYFQHFQLKNVPKQKPGTIDIYSQKTDPVQYDENGNEIIIKIAVEVCVDNSNNTKMFFGNNQKAISNGAWTSEVQPKIKIEKSFEQIYTIVFKYRLSYFLAKLYNNTETGDLFWIVEQKENEIKKGTRVISDEINSSSLFSSNLNTPLNKIEEIGFSLLKNGKTFYSTNLVGTEFKEALRFFINNRF